MTSQIDTQQRGLVEANRELGERTRFTETVLAGVSAGVIGLDDQGRIHLPNRSASELLATDLARAIGTRLDALVPEMADLLDAVMKRPDRPHQAEINVVCQDRAHSLIVSMAAESLDGQVNGYVVTFDDITDLLSAQRKAAWADVARRIAHEIKNPLTPIRLSAERLKRKYLKQIEEDPKTFSDCVETIVRQVEDIGRMVDEFSSFARMPQAILKPENLTEICRQAAFFERARHPSTNYDLDLGDDDIPDQVRPPADQPGTHQHVQECRRIHRGPGGAAGPATFGNHIAAPAPKARRGRRPGRRRHGGTTAWACPRSNANASPNPT